MEQSFKIFCPPGVNYGEELELQMPVPHSVVDEAIRHGWKVTARRSGGKLCLVLRY